MWAEMLVGVIAAHAFLAGTLEAQYEATSHALMSWWCFRGEDSLAAT